MFMSDNANNFYNAWILNFPRPGRELICSWHVDKNWRKGLKSHISTQADMIDVNAALETMQYESDEGKFRKLHQECCAWCENMYSRFYTYFCDTYVKNMEQWALSFRFGAGINTDMTTEAFHNVLKGLYFERKQNRRIDHLLCKMLRIARDKVFDGLIKTEKSRRTYKMRTTDERLKRGEEIHRDEVTQIDHEKWYVKSQEDDNEMHIVSIKKDTCSCIVHCSKCGVCQLMCTCLCVDFKVRGVTCKHIHAVHTRIIKSHVEKKQNITPMLMTKKGQVFATLKTC